MHKRAVLRASLGVGGIVLAAVVLAYSSFMATAQENRIRYGIPVDGSIDIAGEREAWSFDGLRGDTVQVQIERRGGDLTLSAEIAGPEEAVLIALDWPGDTQSVMAFTLTLPRGGSYTLTVRGLGNTTGPYRARLELVNPTATGDGVIAYGRTVTGTIADDFSRQPWSFRGTSGDVIDATMLPVSGDLDTYLSLLSPDGDVVATADSGGASGGAALLAVRLPSNGTYTLVARRAGENSGEAGTTTGDYSLTLTLRSAGDDSARAEPARLATSTEIRGRLNANTPTALYSVEAPGTLALSLDLLNPFQAASVTAMTGDQAIIGVYSGIGTLRAALPLDAPGALLLEVTAPGSAADAVVDFALRVDPVTAEAGIPRPLVFGRPQAAGVYAAESLTWYFPGQAGDLVEISLELFGPVVDGNLQVHAPDGTQLINRVVERSLSQPLALEQAGLYRVEAGPLAGGYQIQVDRQGTAGRTYDQRAVPSNAGMLIAGQPVSGTLAAGESAAWLLDLDDAQRWEFHLEGAAALAVESPQGRTLIVALADDITQTASLFVDLPGPGRCRAVIFSPSGAEISAYTLQAQPASGGVLRTGESGKGSLSDRRPGDVWQIAAPPGALLNVRLRDLSGDGLPAVHIVDPDSTLTASTLFNEPQNVPGLVGVPTGDGGLFEIVVARAAGSAAASYQIAVEIVTPFGGESQPVLVAETDAYTAFTADPVPVPHQARPVIADLLAPAAALSAETLSDAPLIRVEDLVRGEITGGAHFQAWSFSAGTGQMLAFSAASLDGDTPGLALYAPDGPVLAERFASGAGTNTLVHRFSDGGVYTVVVTLARGTRYLLWIDPLAQIHEDVPVVVPGHMLAYGDTAQAEIGLPGDTRTFAFFGSGGDRILAQVIRTAGQTRLNLALADQYGSVLQRVEGSDGDPATTLEGYLLPANGVYQLLVTRADDGIARYGRMTLHLNLSTGPSNAEGGLLEDLVTASLTPRDPVHRWLVSAQAGEVLALVLEPVRSRVPAPLTLELADSAGNVFLRQEARLGRGALGWQEVRVPRTGIYQVIVRGGDREPGFYRLSLSRSGAGPDSMDRSLAYGETAGGLLTRENFLDVWTFVGTQGDVINLAARSVRGDSAVISLQLRTQDGQALATAVSDGSGVRIEQVTLPVSGHYAVVVGNPDGAFEGEAVYELTASLINTAARSMGSTIAGGQSWAGGLFPDDPVDTWVFEGRQGETVTVTVGGADCLVSLLGTDWRTAASTGQVEVLASAQAVEGEPARIEFTLPLSTPYVISVQDPLLRGGSYQLDLVLSSAVEPASVLRPDQGRTGQVGVSDLDETWQLLGARGDTLTVTVTSDSREAFAPVVDLVSPVGQVLAHSEGLSGAEVRIDDFRLPAAGDYHLRISRALGQAGTTQGRYELMLQLLPANGSTPARLDYGSRELDLIDDEDTTTRWLLSGPPGDVVRVSTEVTGGSLDPVLRLTTMDGTPIARSDDARGLDAELYAVLPPEGSVIVEVTRFQGVTGSTSGNYALAAELVYRPGSLPAGETLHYGDRVAGAVDGVALDALWSFDGEAGDVISARLQFAQDDSPLLLALLDSSGGVLADGQRNRGDALIDGFTLPVQGSYTLRVHRPGDARAAFSPYALELHLTGIGVVEPSQGGLLRWNRPAIGQFTTQAASHAWLVEGTAGQAARLSLTGIRGTLQARLSLVAPDGRLMFATQTDASGVLPSDPVILPLDGVYLLLVTGDGLAADVRYRLEWQSSDSPADSLPTLIPGQDGFGALTPLRAREEWSFEAQAGDVLSLRAAVSTGDLIPALVLWDAEGDLVAVGHLEQLVTGPQASLANVVIPESGVYRISVSTDTANTTGSYRLMLRRDAISSRAAAALDLTYGLPAAGYLAPAESRTYAFQGLAGDVVALALRSTGGPAPDMTLETETGLAIDMPVVDTGDAAAIPAFVMPADGRFIVVLQGGTEPSSYEMIALRRTPDVPAESTVRTLGRSQALIDVVQDPAVPIYWRLSADAGEVLYFVVDTSTSGLQAELTLFGPRGYVASTVEQADNPVVNLGPVRMPDDGDYLLRVGSWLETTTGAYTVQIRRAGAEESGSNGGHIPVKGLAVAGGLTAGDGEDLWTFDALAGEALIVRVEPLPAQPTPALAISGPGGFEASSDSGEVRLPAIPETGRYTVQVSATLLESSAIEYRLAVVQWRTWMTNVIGSAQGIDYGEEQTGELNASQPVQTWVFYGRAGEQIAARVIPSSEAAAPVLYLLSPGGEIMVARSGSSLALDGVTLPADGFYGLVLARQPGNAGGLAFTLWLNRLAPGAVPQGGLAGLRAAGSAQLTDVAPVHAWALDAAFSGDYAITVEPLAVGELPQVLVTNPAGETIAGPALGGKVVAYLRAGEPYTALVSGRPAVIEGSYAIALGPASPLTGGGSLSVDQPNLGAIDDLHFTDEWALEAAEGSTLTLEVARVSGDLEAFVTVFDPLGGTLAQQAAGSDGVLSLTLEVPSAGVYRVLVSRVGTGGGPSSGDYTIRVQ